MKKMKGLFRIIFGRTAFVVLFLLIQIGFLFSCVRWLSGYLVYVYGGMIALTVLVVVHILNENVNPSFKIAWMVPVLVIPVFGTLLYLFVQMQIGTKIIAARLKVTAEETAPYLKQEETAADALRNESQGMTNLAHYVKEYGGFPIYQGTSVEYFPLGDDMFPELKRQLSLAKHFIFMEYFIIERGVMWDEILEILEQKAAEGVEVRVMYDGMCSMVLLPYRYPKLLEKKGIQCKMFSPIKPTLSTHQNNRDHRKICVIDGHTAFTGGVNLADEYINQKLRFGHWKDTAVMLQGEAVRSFTMMFLQMWNITERRGEDYKQYLGNPQQVCLQKAAGGFVMPYGDSPLDKENIGELVYIDILNQAKKYVHIMTPYLILDHEMVTALTFAAKRGVETIIIMPHIPDKKYAYMLARSYYRELIEAGVQIYEYTPGFVHAKSFVSDDEKAVVGTINLDFRSLYLHFECGVLMYQNVAVQAVEQDFEETLEKCCRITLEDCRRYPFLKSFAGQLMRFVAPLM
ncbi:MAG: cardiolipin synthase [Lachnospiraceae bacterium]|nr:cardiolipin synthase [Lachnospiraceae bacterium]